MRNNIIAISLFLALLIFVYFSNKSLINLCDSLIEGSNQIEILLDEKDFESAQNKSQEMIKLINDKAVITAIYINHADFDCFFEEASELYIYTKCKDYTESLVAVNSLKELANNIKHLLSPTIENIF
ncbi:MAG: DUF4363 family protein [Clostridium sp.]|nr:DUF4363 family protein [Clostridium sp.]